MKRACAVVVVVLFLVGINERLAAAPPPLLTASGTVVKANANVLILRPRLPDGRFDQAVTLKIRGTSTVTLLRTRGAGVLVQQSTTVKDLQPNQTIAVIYTNTGDEYVLLSAVARP